MSTVTQREPIDVTTLGAHLTTLSKREYPPAWHELAPLLAIAGQHTEHVTGCAKCRRWTDDPDSLGRCDDCSVVCDGCAVAAKSRDDLTLTPCGGEDKWLCEDCFEAREASRRAHARDCECDPCAARREDAFEARREDARERVVGA